MAPSQIPPLGRIRAAASAASNVAKFRADNMPMGGRRAGSRNRLTAKFLEALAADFEEGGAAAIKVCRIEHPDRYTAIIANLMPRSLEIEHNQLGDLTDDELNSLLEYVRQQKAKLIEQQKLEPVL